MNNSKRDFDIVLVLEYFRSVTSYLSIIKYLAEDYRIGIFSVNLPIDLLRKNRAAQLSFISICEEFGATLIKNRNVKTDILIIPQRPYSSSVKSQIKNNIEAKEKIALLSLAWSGIDIHDEFLDFFNIRTVLTLDKNFTQFLLNKRHEKNRYKNRKIIEIGSPFIKYPIFRKLKFDYLIAMPTEFSFTNENEKYNFLKNVLKILNQLDKTSKVLIKSHNGIAKNSFSSKKFKFIASFIKFLNLEWLIDRFILYANSGFFNNFFMKVNVALLFLRILEKVTPFENVTYNSYIGIEAFLPCVKKGVIGGNSNSIWYTLHAELPYYNCIEAVNHNKINKNAEKFLYTNLKYFGVPFCNDLNGFDKSNYKKIPKSCRESDLIKVLTKKLK